MSKTVKVVYETTPNPNSMRFSWGEASNSTADTAFFEDVNASTRSPLAHKLFGFPWMRSVLVGEDFVTIAKADWVDWPVLCEPLADLISEHIESGEALLLEETAAAVPTNATDMEFDDTAEGQIKRILETEIRPAVNMDGGDVNFDSYEDGILKVNMTGACVGCPSSQITLKQGIEARLREAIPELKEVVAV